MDLKNQTEKPKQSPHSRAEKSIDETHSRKSKCSTSEDCSKSVTESEYFCKCDCTSGTPTSKSSASHDFITNWSEMKAILDNSKMSEDKHKGLFQGRFPEKSSVKSHSNLHSEHGCMYDDDMKKAASTQRSDAESYVHNEMFEKKMLEMREIYDLRIKQLHDKLDRANQSNQLLKAQMTKLNKDYNTSMLEMQKDNSTLRRLIKGLSKKASMPEFDNLQKIGQLENCLIMWQRKCQSEAAKYKSLQNHQDAEIRNLQNAHSEKIIGLMKDYQNKLDEMEKSYMDQMSNLETDHQEILAERDKEIKSLRSQIHQQCLIMEQEMNSLKEKKSKDSENVLRELEMQLKMVECKKEAALRFLEGPFFKDFTTLVNENHSLKLLLLKHSSEGWSCVFEEILNVNKELEKLKGDCENVAHQMETRISNLRNGRYEMGDFQDT